jgi:hypothetical protein
MVKVWLSVNMLSSAYINIYPIPTNGGLVDTRVAGFEEPRGYGGK